VDLTGRGRLKARGTYTGIGNGAISKNSMRKSCSERGTVQKVKLLLPRTDSVSDVERDI